MKLKSREKVNDYLEIIKDQISIIGDNLLLDDEDENCDIYLHLKDIVNYISDKQDEIKGSK